MGLFDGVMEDGPRAAKELYGCKQESLENNVSGSIVQESEWKY
jgi:hypothetical protein